MLVLTKVSCTESSGGCTVGGALQPAMLGGIGKVREQLYSGSLKEMLLNRDSHTLHRFTCLRCPPPPPPCPTQPCFMGTDYPRSSGTVVIKAETKKAPRSSQLHCNMSNHFTQYWICNIYPRCSSSFLPDLKKWPLQVLAEAQA